MKLEFGHTWVAAALTGVAIIVPCSAWWVAGSRAAQQEAEAIRRAPREEARSLARNLAEAAGRRLENLRMFESRRPFEHYHAEHLDAGSNCACAKPVSPLAQGPSDPLARAHFQIDEVGRLTVPGIPVQAARDLGSSWARWREDQEQARDELECVQADAPGAAVPAAKTVGGPTLVGPFRWQTVTIEGQAALVAMREVRTAESVLTQGFLVSTPALRRSLGGGVHPAVLAPGPPASETAAALPLEGAAWHVAVDARVAIAAADRRAKRESREFHRSFAFVSGAALLAGLCVVGLVLQNERTARQRARFAAIAAHELRTPLAGMKLYGELLGESLGDPAKRADYARHVAAEAERLGHVVDNVLGFSELERSGFSVHLAPGDLGAEVAGVVRHLQPALADQGVDLDLRIEGELEAVRFDRDALSQMLHNLVDNAEKYTRGASDRRIVVEVAREPNRAVVSVRDFGPGVAEGLRARLFRAFTRSERVGDPAGLGLGLAMVRELAVAQGARAWHETPAGGGARFAIAFPV